MKKNQLLAILLCLLFLNVRLTGNTQTLVAGDVSFTSFTANVTPKRFEFVVWTNLGPNAEIRFTNCGFTDNTGNTIRWMEQYVIWTGPSTGLPKGTVVRVEGNTANYGTVSTYNCSGSGTPSGLTLGNSTGNQIFAFQGSGGAAYATNAAFNGTLLAGIQYQSTAGSSTWLTTPGTPINAATSYLPTSIASFAMVVTGSPGPNEGVYTGPRTGLTAASDYRSRVLNIANWSVQGGTTINPAMQDATAFSIGLPPSISGQPSNSSICAGNNTSFTVTAFNATGYKWQVSTNAGSSFTDLTNAAPYSRVTSATLTITNATAGLNGYQYRCLVSGSASPDATSNAAMLTVQSAGTWLGGTSTAWSNTANWSCGVLPTASTNVTIPAGTVYAPVVDITTAACNNLTINSGATLTIANNNILDIKGNTTNNGSFTSIGKASFSGASQTLPGGTYDELEIAGTGTKTLGGAITVNNGLTLSSSYLSLGNNDLTVGNAGYISGGSASSFIIINGSGRLKQQNIGTGGRTGGIVFPVGTSSASYTPVTLTNTGTADEFGVRVIDGVNGAYTNDAPTGLAQTTHNVNKTWLVTEGTTGGSSVTLTFQWNASDEQSNFTRNSCFAAHYYNGYWHAGSTGAAAGNDPYAKSLSNVTSFSPFSVGSAGSVLPLTLVSFTGKAVNTGNLLQWATSDEINMSFFSIERSTDGTGFTTIGRVAARNGQGEQRYQFSDNTASQAFYRLKMINKDGSYKYSMVVTINPAGKNGNSYAIFPNPVTGSAVYLKPAAVAKERVSVILSDVTGRKWYTGHIEAASLNSGAASIDVRALPGGTYWLLIINEKTGDRSLLKFVK